MVMARFIRKSDEHYPKDALHMYVENEQSIKTNEVVLNDLPHELIQAAQNKKTNK